MKTLSLGYSPCPNDTFIFYALVHGKIDTGDLRFEEILLDVETLNQMAVNGELDITKVSYNAFGNLREDYCLLRSGGALGRGCGPLLVVSSQSPSVSSGDSSAHGRTRRGELRRATCQGEKSEVSSFKNKRIAIPGNLTTAFLLFKLYLASTHNSELSPQRVAVVGDQTLNFVTMPFNKIMEAVKKGEVDAGLIIHESRFTYKSYGLKQVIDLGDWWEKETGLPIPLGCIIAKRSLGKNVIYQIDNLIRESIIYSLSHRDEPARYIKKYSQELEDSVINKHIDLYVNDYSIDIGDDGVMAVKELFALAEEMGIIKKSSKSLFID